MLSASQRHRHMFERANSLRKNEVGMVACLICSTLKELSPRWIFAAFNLGWYASSLNRELWNGMLKCQPGKKKATQRTAPERRRGNPHGPTTEPCRSKDFGVMAQLRTGHFRRRTPPRRGIAMLVSDTMQIAAENGC